MVAPLGASAATHESVARTTIASTDWAAYLDGPSHDSYASSETAISAATVSELRKTWGFTAGQGYLSSPIVVDGSEYIGANNGWFYEINAATGALEHKIFLGTVNITSCPPPPTGMVSTAAAAVDPKSGLLTIYVTAPNGYLYALSPSLVLRWRSVIDIPSHTVNNYFDWSSPTVSHDRIYVGVSSNCDSPLVRGGIVSYNQSTGAKVTEFYTVPAGVGGGSVWSSAAVDAAGNVYITTGNGPETTGASQLIGQSESIVKLTSGLKFIARYQISMNDEGFDTDFGASPVLFGSYVGACNKNGIFYALHQSTMKLAWKKTVSAPAGGNEECIAAPAWNGQHLYLATPGVTIGETSYPGSVQERDPNGQLVWETGLPNAVDGSPSLDGAGILAVGTYDYQSTPNATYLVNAATGAIAKQLITGGDFAQVAFAENAVFVANDSGTYEFRLTAS